MTDSNRIWNISELVAQMRARAGATGLPVIDLGQGAPVDPTPAVVTRALAAAADWPRYPPTQGTARLRAAYRSWAGRRLDVDLPADAMLPTIGSKELIAGLPELLGLTERSLVVIPRLAYPTYSVGAERVGARVLAADSTVALGPARPALIWVNTPANPTGAVLPVDHLRKVVEWARERDCIVASDECYLELATPGHGAVSVLSSEVNGGTLSNILAVHSLSKRSSMAGYRAGFVAGDPDLVAGLIRRRRDLGLILPGPVQAAAAAALDDDEHVRLIRREYRERRTLLEAALLAAGFSLEQPQSGLFCWATRGEPDVDTVAALADNGILAAPGGFYGRIGAQHVRLSLTASTDEVEQAALRIAQM